MEIRNLNTFLRVAALKNFTQAGKELGYSQSNISAQIQQLEREVGAPLFNRIGRTVSLTQYGEELIPYAQQIVSTATHMENFLKSNKSLAGTVKVGIVESIFNVFGEDLFLNFNEEFPHVSVEVTVDATSTLKERLYNGTLDFACVIDDPLSASEWNMWYTESVPVSVIANPSHILCKKKSLKAKDLSGMNFIMMEDTAPYTLNFSRLMSEKNISFKTILRLQSADIARKIIEKENFLSVLPVYSVKESTDLGKLKILDIKDIEITQFVQIILHPGRVVTPQVEGMLNEVKKSILSNLIENK